MRPGPWRASVGRQHDLLLCLAGERAQSLALHRRRRYSNADATRSPSVPLEELRQRSAASLAGRAERLQPAAWG